MTSTAVNADAGDGLWISVSDLARQKGVDKAAVSRRISRLESLGSLETRTGARGTKLVNIAAYDRAVGETGDAIRTMNGAGATHQPPPSGNGSDPILAREQARRTAYQADIAKLDLDERLKKLLPVEDIASAIGICAEGIVRVLDQLPSRADELASAVGKDGALGARAVLKIVARDLRSAIERELRKLAENGVNAPAPDEEADAA
ncbi:MarR family transcriptional regulator [Methylocella tundrae]|uniref:MarR family transcriptional regulator n=1 Tax=Methylocella tundrae TaxID=227605 RepID=UPI00157B5E27|nr:MarR family transcriptional regulator [Methylocella tundrae]